MIIEKWKNVQAYEIGKLHISRNMVCQDRTFYKEANGVKIVALADGAGSKSKSEIGAELVCEKVCELFSTKFIDYLLYFEDEKTNQAKHKKNMASLSKEIITYLVTALKGLKVLPIGIGDSARLDILDMFSPKVKAKCITNMDVFVKLFEMLSVSMSQSDNTVFDWLNDQV